jgi:TetR/AcrR family transcriptional regulator, mexJK operon transcriptional repressor
VASVRADRAGGAGPKGEAIASAALRLFLRDGYERTSVDAIAAEAGVSKRTIYNRYGEKETLFLSVLRDTFAGLMEEFARIVDAHLTDVTDVEQALTGYAREAARAIAGSPERGRLTRLIIAEAPHFPALLRQQARSQTMSGILAQRLTALAAAGWLQIHDQQEAAEHLLALTTGQINNRSLFGVAEVSDADIERIVTSGVRAFVRAYRPA